MVVKPDTTLKDKGAQKSAEQSPKPVIDLKEAQRFLDRLDPTASSWTFQTFDDTPRKRARLKGITHGTLKELGKRLSQYNEGRAGVFVAINHTDGQGRKRENIEAVRALFLDLDGAPLDLVNKCKLVPHLVVESSPGRFHVYWRVKGMPLEQFEDVQRGLAKRFDGDPAVALLTACARLPGFWHNKAEPFRTRIVEDNKGHPYTVEEVVKEFAPEKKGHKAPISHKDGLILPIGAPVEAAEAFLKHKYQVGEVLLLAHYRGAFYAWFRTHYKEYSVEALEAELYGFLRAASVRKANGHIEPYNPTRHKIDLVVHALRRGCLLDGEQQVPFWIPKSGETPRPAPGLISCQNGFLDLRTRTKSPHDPSLFIPNCVPFNYGPKAPEPKRFLQLLGEIWPADKVGDWDQEAEDTLQEIFGYPTIPANRRSS
jgi:hypothetical protein